LILAPPKVGKTTATGVIIKSLLTGKQISNFIPILPKEKKVIVWIDTEQGKPECIKMIRSISKHTTGNESERHKNLYYVSLRGKGKDFIIMAIEFILETVPGIGFIVIDGIRDLVSSINDEKEAAFITEKLMKWTQDNNIHILTILHQNKGDENGRGHIGTELTNKAETIAALKRGETNGKRITIIDPKYTRHGDFESFAFSIDEDGTISDSLIKAGFESKKPTVEQLTHTEITEILERVFLNGESYKYTKLEDKLYEVTNDMFESFGKNKCTDLYKRLKNERYIIQKDGSTDWICHK